jgi:cytochrome b561
MRLLIRAKTDLLARAKIFSLGFVINGLFLIRMCALFAQVKPGKRPSSFLRHAAAHITSAVVIGLRLLYFAEIGVSSTVL